MIRIMLLSEGDRIMSPSDIPKNCHFPSGKALTVQKQTTMTKTYHILANMALMLLVCFKVEAQQPDFLFEYPGPENIIVDYTTTFYGFCTLEIAPENEEKNSYILAVNHSERDYDTPYFMKHAAKVVKVSKEGSFLKELAISNETEYTCIDDLFHYPDEPSCCLAIGRTWGNGQASQTKVFLAKFDVDLNLLWQREVRVPENYSKLLASPNYLMDSQGDIVCYTGGSYDDYPLYFRMSAEGELAILHESPNVTISISSYNQGLFEYQDGSGDYGQILKIPEWNQDERCLVRMDRNFDTFSYRSLPMRIERPLESTTVWYDPAPAWSLEDGSVIIASEGHFGWWDSIVYGIGSVIAIMKFDSNDSVVGLSHAGAEGGMYHLHDSIMHLNYKEFDLYGETLYCCFGMYEHHYGFEGLQGPNSFGVARIDTDANIVWERYYRDYRQIFKTYSITATSDEGCLVAGMCCNTYYKEPKAFVIKFFPDGTLSVPGTEAFVRPYTYYPNPAQDELHLHFSPDVTPTQIELFDLQGRMVRSQRNGFESLNLQGLAPGAYTMRVTLEGGKVFSDKVVKE